MKKILMFSVLSVVLSVMVPLSVFAELRPEKIEEKMAIKFVRGASNTGFSFLEFPKQIGLTVNEMGPAGFLVGPLKGVGMTAYRSFIGLAEMVFCMVPAPGYYDPMMDPSYVWQGWEPIAGTPIESPAEEF